jgi:hypothetical protein
VHGTARLPPAPKLGGGMTAAEREGQPRLPAPISAGAAAVMSVGVYSGSVRCRRWQSARIFVRSASSSASSCRR